MKLTIDQSTPIVRTSRVLQLEGLFDVPPAERTTHYLDVDLPLDERPWHIGLIVGPSGSGKTQLAQAAWPESLARAPIWPQDRAIVDAFDDDVSIKDIVDLLSSVGFSSPPSWLKPFRVLSTGEQFRATVARVLAEGTFAVIDEFTSVVDRQVAQIGSAAIAKTVRKRGQQFVAVTCHYDVEDWLQPDWVYQPHTNDFHWRELQRRPSIPLVLARTDVAAWRLFRQHHYLSSALSPVARCFLASLVDGTPAAFVAVIPNAGHHGRWREHRCVCLPDFQGIGLGARVSEAVAALTIAATRGRYSSVTGHPAFVRSRARSPHWRMKHAPNFNAAHSVGRAPRESIGPRVNRAHFGKGMRSPASFRFVATFDYIGPPWPDVTEACRLWQERLPRR